MKNNDVFGIDGYNLPRLDLPVKYGTQNAFAKDKLRNFATLQANLTKHVPGPGEYKTVPKWGCVEKKVHATRKNTYIDNIFRYSKNKPGPAEVIHYTL